MAGGISLAIERRGGSRVLAIGILPTMLSPIVASWLPLVAVAEDLWDVRVGL